MANGLRLLWACMLLVALSTVGAADLGTMSFNSEVMVVPAPGPVSIDGKTDDWDLSAGVWSYNSPTIVEKFSVWTHLMWDAKGIYFLARFADKTPMQNPTMGKDFSNSWKNDCYQARVVFDDRTAGEHEMHVNIFYSAPEKKPYMIVKHGGFMEKPPYDETGPDRPDQLERFGPTMEAAGGKVACREWDDHKGWNAEAFWPWAYCRLDAQPLKPGEQFTFGIEALWGGHRLADGIKNEQVNRIFMFRARNGWGRAVISDKGKLKITEQQVALQAARLKQFVDYDTYGSIPIAYALPDDREATIAIDDAQGRRVRNLFGQYPRKTGKLADLWDGLDDGGKPVAPGNYTAWIVDHKPLELKFVNSLYNAATPPWLTETGSKLWGGNHGSPATVATRGDVTLVGFVGVEGTTGLLRVGADGLMQWAVTDEVADVTIGEKLAWTLSINYAFQKCAVQRYDVQTGQLIPFEDQQRSPYVALPVELAKVPVASTIAFFDGKLHILVLGHNLFKMNPNTGAIEDTLDVGDLCAITAHDDKLYSLHKDGTVDRMKAGGPRRKMFRAAGVAEPLRLAVDPDDRLLAISSRKTNQVFIFDAMGKLQQTIGTAYEGSIRPAGKFIETDLACPLGLDFDSQGRLWIAEANMSSRRVTCWTPDGKLAMSFWGGADYGAMSGFPITFDSTRFIAHGVEFKLDPKPDPWKRPTAEKPLFYHPDLYQSAKYKYTGRGLVYKYKGFEYAVTAPGYNIAAGFIIAKRGKDDVFHACVSVDYATRKQQNGQWVNVPARAWIDRNDNGKEEPDEITSDVKGANVYWACGWIRPDLTIITANQWVYPLKGLTETGVPLYDFANPVRPPNTVVSVERNSTGGTVVMDAAGNISDGIVYHTVDGRQGAYPNRYGRHDAPAAQRGVLIAPFRTNGLVEGVPGVGSITALGGDRGEWFIMTMNGLYVSSILQDSKADITLDETFVGQESFGGFIWRDETGRVLVQLGGPSYRIMEVRNLDTCRKQKLTLTVTQQQIDAGAKIAASREQKADAEPAELRVARIAALPAAPAAPDLEAGKPLIQGAPDFRVQQQGDPSRWWRAALAHDGTTLAIMFQVADSSPWKNGEGRFTHAFIGGDCVDLKLDVPGRGPIRLLAAPIAGQDTAVLWQQKAAQKDNPVSYMVGNNPANAQNFDVVRRVSKADVKQSTGMAGYSVLVTVPLAELGIDPAKQLACTGLVGVIFSNPAGTNRVARLYWHDKATDLVSDVPSEARLDPARWGRIVFDK